LNIFLIAIANIQVDSSPARYEGMAYFGFLEKYGKAKEN